MKFVQRKFYIPEDTYAKMSWLAKSEGKTITEVLRGFVEDGLRKKKKKKNGFRGLLELARRAQEEGWGKGGPSDLVKNHDKYFVEVWEKTKGK